MEHRIALADQLFFWTSNFCSRWIYHVRVQDYLRWSPARLASSSWSCSFYRVYQQPSIYCEHSHWNLCWWHRPAPWAVHSKLPSCSTYPALQEAINCTEEWAECWHGHAKTRMLSPNKDIMLEAPTMEGHAVTVTDNHRHLGVVLSDDLKWSKHAQCIMAAASKRAGAGLLRLMARDLPLPVASTLYVYYYPGQKNWDSRAHVVQARDLSSMHAPMFGLRACLNFLARVVCYRYGPVLEYASPVWHGSLQEEDTMSLERIQASVARSLLQADWFSPKEELFRQLGWPALRWRREITSLTMFHKLLHSRPEPLREGLFQYASATSAHSRRKRMACGGYELRWQFQLLLPHTHHTLQRIFFL